MMMRMDRAMAHWAMLAPRLRAMRRCRSPRKVAVPLAPLAAWVHRPRRKALPWPFLPNES